jgi:hypothetical protein
MLLLDDMAGNNLHFLLLLKPRHCMDSKIAWVSRLQSMENRTHLVMYKDHDPFVLLPIGRVCFFSIAMAIVSNTGFHVT